MGKTRFSFNTKENDLSAKEELAKIQVQEFYNYQIVPYDEIEINELNDYPISDIEELVNEIKENGLIKPLGIILNKNYQINNQKKYRLYDGERRYTAIGLILKNNPNFPPFKKGIPCMVEKKELSKVEEEIKLILANKQRNMTEDFKRKKAQRLLELYKEKAKGTGEKTNITKLVAKDLDIGERQVRRYNSLSKLIPELQKAFDESKFNLENAASIANMDEDSQKAILSLIKDKEKIGSEELARVKNESEMLKKEVEKMEETIKKQTSITEELKNTLQEKEKAIENAKKNEEEIRIQIKKELESSNPDKQKINILERKIKELNQEKESLAKESNDAQKSLEVNQKTVEDLKKQLNQSTNNEISKEIKDKLREEAAISSLEKDLEKKLQEYSISINNFRNKYGTPIVNEGFVKKVTHITNSLTNK